MIYNLCECTREREQTIGCCIKQIAINFPCISPVIGQQFCHKIAKKSRELFSKSPPVRMYMYMWCL